MAILVQVLKDPDKSSSVMARRWTGVRLRDSFFVTPSRKTVFVLNVKGFYENGIKDFKICTDHGKQWMRDVTTAKLYVETLRQFKRQPKVEMKDNYSHAVRFYIV
jgi:hypothetical protein